MTQFDELPEEDLRPSLAYRARAWAATDVGGWTIIGSLAILVLACLALVAFQLRPRAEVAVEPPLALGAVPPASVVQAFTLSPEALQKLSYEEARAYNATLPFSTAPNPPALRFIAPTEDVQSYGRALDCLTAAVYYEAGSETAGGQAAVAQVVINRSRHPAYPRTICGVVFQGSERTSGCQFTFTCDGALARVPNREGWGRARAVATAALNGFVATSVGLSTHYHTDWVAPYWAPRLVKLVKIGTHIFYRWPGAWGRPSAFTRAYAPPEPVVDKLTAMASPIEVIEPLEDLTPVGLAMAVLETPKLAPAGFGGSAPELAEASAPAAPAEPSPPPPTLAQQAAEREARRTAAVIADPLANPAQTRPQRRQRVPAPSGW